MPTSRITIFYWCQDTALVPFETGIQRVVRRLAAELTRLDVTLIPVGWDNRSRHVVALPTGSTRGGQSIAPLAGAAAILLIPEIPLSLVGAGLDPFAIGRSYGLRTVGLLHDLIPIKLAVDYSADAVAGYRRCYRQFAAADLVLTTTEYVAADLRDFLASEHLTIPSITVVPLPAELAGVARQRGPAPLREPDDPLKLVAVTTWEPRKNILRLLRAIGRCSTEGLPAITLDLVGRRGAFLAYDQEVLATAEPLPSVTIHGTVTDAKLVALYAGCHASIYPSLEEGFGLPILESLWVGRPCLCHHGSSMAEIAPGGGTLLLDMADEGAIAEALRDLAADPERLRRYALEAVERPLEDWHAFAVNVLERVSSLL